MAKKTGWKAVFSIKKYQKPNSNNEATGTAYPKSVLVRYGVWEEVVEQLISDGGTQAEICECFKEYGCTAEEILGYFVQYSEPAP